VLEEAINKTLTETIQKDKTQYQRFGSINDNYQFIEKELHSSF
jgi:DNA repair photolyase